MILDGYSHIADAFHEKARDAPYIEGNFGYEELYQNQKDIELLLQKARKGNRFAAKKLGRIERRIMEEGRDNLYEIIHQEDRPVVREDGKVLVYVPNKERVAVIEKVVNCLFDREKVVVSPDADKELRKEEYGLAIDAYEAFFDGEEKPYLRLIDLDK